MVNKLDGSVGLNDAATAVHRQGHHFPIFTDLTDGLLYFTAKAGKGNLRADDKRRAGEIDIGPAQGSRFLIAVAASGHRKIRSSYQVSGQLFPADGGVSSQALGQGRKRHVGGIDDERARIKPHFFVLGDDGPFRVADQAEVAASFRRGQGEIFLWRCVHVVAIERGGGTAVQVNDIRSILSRRLLLFDHGTGVGAGHG